MPHSRIIWNSNTPEPIVVRDTRNYNALAIELSKAGVIATARAVSRTETEPCAILKGAVAAISPFPDWDEDGH